MGGAGFVAATGGAGGRDTPGVDGAGRGAAADVAGFAAPMGAVDARDVPAEATGGSGGSALGSGGAGLTEGVDVLRSAIIASAEGRCDPERDFACSPPVVAPGVRVESGAAPPVGFAGGGAADIDGPGRALGLGHNARSFAHTEHATVPMEFQ